MLPLWRDQARQDLRQIFDFTLEENLQGAQRIQSGITKSIDLLVDQPSLGRTGRVARTRELVIPRTPYIAVYMVDARSDTVTILRIFHDARLWPQYF